MRVAIREALGGDTALNNLGIVMDRIWPNHALDGAPRDGIPWLVLRFGQSPPRFGRQPGGARSLTVWAYNVRQKSSDFTLLDEVLARVTQVLLGTDGYTGTDGSVITQVDFRGYSEDLTDDGYDAIAKNAAFTVVCRDGMSG